MNGTPGFYGNGFLHRDAREHLSVGTEIRRSRSTQDIYRYNSHFDGSKIFIFVDSLYFAAILLIVNKFLIVSTVPFLFKKYFLNSLCNACDKDM